MKNNISLLLILFSFACFSQSEVNSIEKLSTYFKENIPENLLKSVTYPKNKSAITISFYVNKENVPFSTRTNSLRNTKLNKKLTSLFENFPLDSLDFNFKTDKKYTFQVVSKSGNNNILKISSKIDEISAPNCKECDGLDFYQDITSCLNNKISAYIYKNIDFTLSENVSNKNDLISINLKLIINTLGALKLKTIKAPDVFQKNIKQIINNYPETFSPKNNNNRPKNYEYDFYLSFKKGDSPKQIKLNVNFDTIFKPTSTNDFALYLKKNLTNLEVENANLNNLNDRISIYFELDKNNIPVQIKTTSRSKKLETKIISLFKNYDLKKLNFVEKHDFNRYFTSIIIFDNNKNVVKTNEIIGYSRTPIFKKCKKSINVKASKACFNKQIQLHFVKNFKANLVNKLGLSPGRKRIFISFKINKKGKFTNIICRAPHKKIKLEVLRVMKKLPKVKPAIFGRKPANIKYSIPFTLIVE